MTDSWENIEADIERALVVPDKPWPEYEWCLYFGAHGCVDCRSHDIDGDCLERMLKDVLRRAKELAIKPSDRVHSCATCQNFGYGMCAWSWKRVSENDFCSQWSNGEVRDD